MGLPQLPAGVRLSCPLCGADVFSAEDNVIRCEAGHTAGRVDDGIPDFRRSRSGVDAELVQFWSSSPAYYEEARAANVDYDDDGHASHRAVISALASAGTSTLLDVGCGTGELGAELARRVPAISYVGVDVSLLAARTALALERPGVFIAADAESLPFAAESFDAVVSLFALEHFAHPKETLDELCRVLRPGGTLALLSLSYDRAWGTLPSRRLGLSWRGRRLPRAHPANVVVYAVNRLRYAARQALKQVRYAVDGGYRSFELVERPLVLDEGYAVDRDAVHVVSGRSVQRQLQRGGISVVDSSLGTGLGAIRIPFDLRIIGRKLRA